MNSATRCLRGLALGLVVAAIGLPAAGAQQLWNIEEVAVEPAPPIGLGGVAMGAAAAGGPTGEAATVQVAFDYLRRGMGYLELPLPGGSMIAARNAVFEDRGDGNLMWTGEVAGAGYESVVLTVQDGYLVGRFGGARRPRVRRPCRTGRSWFAGGRGQTDGRLVRRGGGTGNANWSCRGERRPAPAARFRPNRRRDGERPPRSSRAVAPAAVRPPRDRRAPYGRAHGDRKRDSCWQARGLGARDKTHRTRKHCECRPRSRRHLHREFRQERGKSRRCHAGAAVSSRQSEHDLPEQCPAGYGNTLGDGAGLSGDRSGERRGQVLPP